MRRERRVSPDDMKKLVAVANCVMCATCYALCPVVSRRSGVRRAGRDRVRVPLHRRRSRLASAKNAPRRSAKITSGSARTATRARTVPNTSIRRTTSSPSSARRSKTASDERPRSAPRAGRRENDQADRHAARDRSHSRHGRPLQHQRAASRSRRSALRLALAGKMPPMFLKPVPKVDEVRTIFDTLEAPVLA